VVTVSDAPDAVATDRPDVVLVGPGPGDPRDRVSPRIVGLRELTRTLLVHRTPLLAVCLGHQIVAGLLGLPLHRRPAAAQGQRREITFFGRRVRVGCYNSFAAYWRDDHWCAERPGGSWHSELGPVRISRDLHTGEVHGLAAARLRTMQFHLESVLTEPGPDLLAEALLALRGAQSECEDRAEGEPRSAKLHIPGERDIPDPRNTEDLRNTVGDPWATSDHDEQPVPVLDHA
jgi:phenazine biosynthesis protein phzE